MTADAAGNKVVELRYSPFGEVRYAWGSQVTDFTYTGQRSEMDAFGLMYYRAASPWDNARWYDPALGRFAQADTLIPGAGNPLAWDRYAYTLNNPLRYVDLSGHFTEDAIKDYLLDYFGGNRKMAMLVLEKWKDDKNWWSMLTEVKAGDVLFGVVRADDGAEFSFGFVFDGEGNEILAGISPAQDRPIGLTLFDIYNESYNLFGDEYSLTWIGIFRESQSPQGSFSYTKPGTEAKFIGTPGDDMRNQAKWISRIVAAGACLWATSTTGGIGCGLAVDIVDERIYDWANIEETDHRINIGPIPFTLQLSSGASAKWAMEDWSVAIK